MSLLSSLTTACFFFSFIPSCTVVIHSSISSFENAQESQLLTLEFFFYLHLKLFLLSSFLVRVEVLYSYLHMIMFMQ